MRVTLDSDAWDFRRLKLLETCVCGHTYSEASKRHMNDACSGCTDIPCCHMQEELREWSGASGHEKVS